MRRHIYKRFSKTWINFHLWQKILIKTEADEGFKTGFTLCSDGIKIHFVLDIVSQWFSNQKEISRHNEAC